MKTIIRSPYPYLLLAGALISFNLSDHSPRAAITVGMIMAAASGYGAGLRIARGEGGSDD